MSFFDDAVGTAKSVGKTVGKRTELLLIISKKKLEAVELENKLDRLYAELGKNYREVLKGSEDYEEENAEIAEEIDTTAAGLDAVRSEIDQLTKKNRKN